MNQQEPTFVYDQVEVKKTGRKAVRPAVNKTNCAVTLYEITPVHEYDGLWKKWVVDNALFIIDSE